MKSFHISIAMLMTSLFLVPAVQAQAPAPGNQNVASPALSARAAEVPRLIKFSGTLLDAQDRPLPGPVGVTFALHAQQTGGAALWMETQNVEPDARGMYTVLLGANSAKGVPAELFVSGEARWLEVQVERQAAQPRVLLVSVPYALKAGDAETLGGKPASAFLTTETLTSAGNSAAATASAATRGGLPKSSAATTGKKAASTVQTSAACAGLTSGGAAPLNSVAKFTGPCAVDGSAMTETAGKVSIVGSSAGLSLSGAGTHQVTLTGASSGRLGQDAQGFFFASDTPGEVIKFDTNNGTLHEWMRITSAGNVGIGTQSPAAKLDVAGGNLALPNTTSGGTAGVVILGGTRFLHNFGINNTFVGASAGNMSMSGGFNSALGTQALQNNTTGSSNSAFGQSALASNTTACCNSAFGQNALASNTSGLQNSAFGFNALQSNTTGIDNSAFGVGALFFSTTGFSNSGFGEGALENNSTGGTNAAFGDHSLFFTTTGSGNSAFGSSALFSNTTGGNNAAFGSSALLANTTGSSNIASGTFALSSNTTGVDNAASGTFALESNTTGNNNTALGASAGLTATSANANTTGSNNTFVGFNSGPGTSTPLTNATAIGANALVNCSNCMVLGDSTIPMLVGIGTNSPAATLDVTGSGLIAVLGSTNASSGSGVSGSAFGQGGMGVAGHSPVDTNSGIGVFGSANNVGSVAGQFGNESGGNILIGTGSLVAKVFRVDGTGKVFANGGFACPNATPSACLSTGSADFAEAIESVGEKDTYEPGDVLVIDPTGRRRVALASEPYSTRVAGIYSTRPAVLGGAADEATLKVRIPLAMVGIVPCKVTTENGPVTPGDLLVTSSTPGQAMKGTNRQRMLGAVVGKALEPFDPRDTQGKPLREATGVIQVLVTLQ